MPCIAYISKRFSKSSQVVITQANAIISDYMDQNLILTLRQLYYRFVASGMIANRQSEYKRLGNIVNDGRLAGLIDWTAIEDRGRNLNIVSAWEDPSEIVAACANGYAIDMWEDQKYRVEVWVEKQALESVVEGAARPLAVPTLACKGYMSQSEMWRAARRFRGYLADKQTPIIIHLGDHDPSGIDMTRDIQDRLAVFGVDMEVRRIALNMDQVDEYDPPPNPAKTTDSRAEGYIMEYGDDSWELDALEPAVMRDLIQKHIKGIMNKRAFKARKAKQEEEREILVETSERWEDVREFLEDR